MVAEEVAIPCYDSWMYVEDTDLSGVNPLRFWDMDKMIQMDSSSLPLPLVGSCHVSWDLGLKQRGVKIFKM